jgi:predicted ATPase
MTASPPHEIEPPSGRASRGGSPSWLAALPLSSFVGRAATLEALHKSLLAGERLVTLVGPPGIGKTRLAARYAQTYGNAYPTGGAWFCDLTLARDAVQATAAVCTALGILTTELPAHAGGRDAVGTALASRGATLLVLDNFEQLVHAADLVARWCLDAPLLRVLVTSRERLRVAGETVIELGPLELPSAGDRGQAILEREAARLFADRARGAGANPSASDAEAIGALVRALDGIPLAIELAAARTRLLAPAEILARLHQRFEVLKGQGRLEPGARGASPHRERHATLERAIDWSWDLLAPWEQDALAQCSVFAGGFSLAAAEAVLGPRRQDSPPLLEVIDALSDKSLVTVRPAGNTRRFGLYVSIRDYAATKLGEELGRQAMERHACFYLGEAEKWSLAMNRRADPSARASLLEEQENVAAVFHRAASAPPSLARATEAIRAVIALYPALESHGPLDELLAMVERAVQLADTPGVPASLKARALFARGETYGFRGKLRESISDLEAALQMAKTAGDEGLLGEALVWLSVRYRHAGRYTEALAACDRAHAILGRIGSPRMAGLNLAVRGRMRGELGQRSESRTDNEQAMAIFRELGDRWYEGLTLANLGQLDMEAGDLDESRWYYEEALVAFREVGDGRYEGRYLGYLGCLDWESGDLATAKTRLAEAIEILERVRTLNYAPLFRAALGGVLAGLGDIDGALRELDRADNSLVNAGVPAFVAAAECHRGHLELARARLALARGKEPEAERLSRVAIGRIATARRAVDESVTGTGRPLLECSDDVRFAVRMLERAAQVEPPKDPATLSVGPEARWFAVGAERVDLTRRGPIRLMLLALVRQRQDRPDVALRQEALLAAGWPGERVQAEAGSKRVRVAVSTLRRLGLETLLVTRDDGYLLDPAVDLREA